MNITHNVILDLLPLYLADEASEDTRTLVKAYLDEHPEHAHLIEPVLLELVVIPAPAPMGRDHELKTIERTKAMLKLRSLLMGVAIFFTTAPLAGYQVGRHRWSMISNFSAGAIACGVLAVAMWIAYFSLQRRLRNAV